MKPQSLELFVCLVVANAVLALPLSARAQSNPKSVLPEKKAPSASTPTAPVPEKKSTTVGKEEAKKKQPQSAGPFRGKLAALDKSAKTITVGKRTFHITSETKILRSDKPATLEDSILGEMVSGGFKLSGDGKLMATKLNLGPKVDSKQSDSGKTKAKKKSAE